MNMSSTKNIIVYTIVIIVILIINENSYANGKYN